MTLLGFKTILHKKCRSGKNSEGPAENSWLLDLQVCPAIWKQISKSLLHDQKIGIILLILDFKLGTIDNWKDYLQTWGEFFFFIVIFFFWIKTVIQDFLLDIYSTYKSFVWTTALGLEFSGSNDIVLILPLY